MLTSQISIVPANCGHSRHWKFLFRDNSNSRNPSLFAHHAASAAARTAELFPKENLVFTLNGHGLREPFFYYNGANVYVFSSRDEKLSFFKKSLGLNDDFRLLKAPNLLPSKESRLRRLVENSVYYNEPATLRKLASLHQKLERYSDAALEVRSPENTYISHLVVLPRKPVINFSELIRLTCDLGQRIAAETLGDPGLFALTYNGSQVRSLSDTEHLHLDFFLTRQDKIDQFKRALSYY